MTETVNTNSSEQSAPELSGIDLARVALHQAREAAKARGEGSTRKAKRRTCTTPVRHDGREPAGFAAVLQGLMADRAWAVPAAGGSILDQWPAIAAAVSPNLPAHVAAVAFHAETGQLDLRPDSPAYATQLRLISARIVAAANESARTDAVRSVRVLAVGAAPRTDRPASQAPAASDVSKAPVKTREMTSPGFHQALAAHQAVTPPSRIDPSIAEAVERQTKAMRALSLRAFPEPEVSSEDQPTPIEAVRAQGRREAEATRSLALRRARAERAARKDSTAAGQLKGAAVAVELERTA
ncbi:MULTISPECIES: DciA family protein [unclassified Streptomyces]|uniref:DciA family protein n=1 Tax=unclassified Streptomyces TaxID=2593676 RepID=UPI0033DFC4A7